MAKFPRINLPQFGRIVVSKNYNRHSIEGEIGAVARKQKYLYHIASIDDIPSIAKTGLQIKRSNYNRISLTDDPSIRLGQLHHHDQVAVVLDASKLPKDTSKIMYAPGGLAKNEETRFDDDVMFPHEKEWYTQEDVSPDAIKGILYRSKSRAYELPSDHSGENERLIPTKYMKIGDFDLYGRPSQYPPDVRHEGVPSLNPASYPNEPSVKNPKFMQKKEPMRYIRIPSKKLEDKEIRSPLVSKPQSSGKITASPSEQNPTEEEITQVTEGLAPKTHYDWITGIPMVRQYVKVKDILPYETKERGFNKDEKKIAEYMELQRYGDMAPIAVSRLKGAPNNEPYQAYEGHHRLEAANRLGKEYILADVNDVNVPLSPGRQLELKGGSTLRWQDPNREKQASPLPPELSIEPSEEEVGVLRESYPEPQIVEARPQLERQGLDIVKSNYPIDRPREEKSKAYAGSEEEQEAELESLYGDQK